MFTKKFPSFVAFCALLFHFATYASDQELDDQRKQQAPYSTTTHTSATPVADSEDYMTIDIFAHVLPHLKIVDVIQASTTCENWKVICNSEIVWKPIAQKFPGYEWGKSVTPGEPSKNIVKVLTGIYYTFNSKIQELDSPYHTPFMLSLAKSFSKLPTEVVQLERFVPRHTHQVKLKNGETFSLITPNVDGDILSKLYAINSTGTVAIGQYLNNFQFIAWKKLKDGTINTKISSSIPNYKFCDVDENGEISVGSYGAFGIEIPALMILELGTFNIEKLLQNHRPKDQKLLTADHISSNGKIIKGSGKYGDAKSVNPSSFWNPLGLYGKRKTEADDTTNSFEWYMSVPSLHDLQILKQEGIDFSKLKFIDPDSIINQPKK